MRESPARRRVLAGIGVGLLAGCVGSDGGSGGSSTEPGTTESGTDAPTSQSGGSALDLREANVVGVTVARDGDAYDFEVTLHHDDDGEDGYANWWQVERLDGERLGRRELRHAHARQPFTRAATVAVPADVGCVVVRGHDETHGYGGRLAVVDLDSGAVRGVDQGTEPESVGPEACPDG
jgi:hypothetical protein